MTLGPLPVRQPEPGRYMARVGGSGQPVEVEVKPWRDDPSVMCVSGWCLWRDAHRIFSSWQRSGLHPPIGDGPVADAFRRLVAERRHYARVVDGREPRPEPGKYRIRVDPYRVELNPERDHW